MMKVIKNACLIALFGILIAQKTVPFNILILHQIPTNNACQTVLMIEKNAISAVDFKKTTIIFLKQINFLFFEILPFLRYYNFLVYYLL